MSSPSYGSWLVTSFVGCVLILLYDPSRNILIIAVIMLLMAWQLAKQCTMADPATSGEKWCLPG